MAKYYNADTLLEFIKNNTPTIEGQTTLQCVERAINEAPTADVVEVWHSRWENISGFDVCNICGTSPAYCEPKPNNPKGYPPYCHNCGAKMDGKDNNVPANGRSEDDG